MISIDYRDIEFKLSQKEQILNWIEETVDAENKSIDQVLFTFCSDEELLVINQNYLDHDTFTDIITFPYQYNPIQSEIYISIDRVRENAKLLQQDFDHELKRVMIHGILHMCGYGDKSEEEQLKMRSKEDEYLERFASNSES